MMLNKEYFQQFKENDSELEWRQKNQLAIKKIVLNNVIYLHRVRTFALGPNLNTRPDIKPVIKKNNIMIIYFFTIAVISRESLIPNKLFTNLFHCFADGHF